tara:strand:+ start:636 stop:1022 length:387 start_codon:yes stop_codon:yes gene_type:complete
MSLKSAILSLFLICTGSIPILANEYQPGFSSSKTCTRNEYREEYIPGTRKEPGYVKAWEETVEVPCPSVNSTTDNKHFDNNDCSEGTVAGGILGAGLATAISRGKDRWWAIPTGFLGGSMIGCQIDGG